jgi:hypothetical protein
MNKTTISTATGAVLLTAGALLPVTAANATTAPSPGGSPPTSPTGSPPESPTSPGGESPTSPGTESPTSPTGSPTSPTGSPTSPTGSPTSPGTESPSSPGGGAVQPKAVTVTVTENDDSLKLSKTTFTPGPYVFTAKNAGSKEHALAISGPGITTPKRTPGISPGTEAKLHASLQPGTYQLWSPTDNDRSMGLNTKITVSGSGGVVPPASPTQPGSPTQSPTGSPTQSPTGSPTQSPTGSPTESPTGSPTGGGAPGGY